MYINEWQRVAVGILAILVIKSQQQQQEYEQTTEANMCMYIYFDASPVKPYLLNREEDNIEERHERRG